MATPRDIVAFWRDAGPGKWFRGGVAFDDECRARFHDAHMAASRRECDHWIADADGALALLLLLDQVPRNIFRGSAHGYATDPLACRHAAAAIAAGHDQAFEPALRAFFYLPYEHSEDLLDQRRALALFAALGDDNYLAYAQAHHDAIARFGRFPHRNRALGRDSTPEEQAWLDAGGGFG